MIFNPKKIFFSKLKYQIYNLLQNIFLSSLNACAAYSNRYIFLKENYFTKKSSGKYEIWHVYQNKIELVQYFLFFGVRGIETFFFQKNSKKTFFANIFCTFF